MAELADVCIVLGLFDGNGDVNPDFVWHLAAFLMLRDLLSLPLYQNGVARATGADRTQLLALWVGPARRRGCGWYAPWSSTCSPPRSHRASWSGCGAAGSDRGIGRTF
jgi:hypothetical protein